MRALDLAVVGVALGATAALGLWSARRAGERDADWFVAGRRLTLPAFVASLVSTWYGGVLGVGEYSYTWGFSNWLVMGVPYYVAALLFALLFAGKARETGEFTLPGLLFDTYGRGAGTIGTLVVLALSLPAAYLLMLGVLLRRMTGAPQAGAIAAAAAFCCGYIALRGFRGVVRAKGLQFVLMYGAFFLLLPAAVLRAGSPAAIAAALPAHAFTWDGGRGAGYVIAWYFIALQTLVEPTFFQRCYAARSARQARTGILASVAFFALFDALTTFTGVYARALVPGLPSGVDAFPALGEALLPTPLLGLFYAGLCATVMSTIDSYFLVGGATLGRDLLWRLTGGRADQVTWSRAGIAVVALLAAAIAIGSQSVVALWYGFGSVGTATLLPPLAGVFYPALRPPRRIVAWGMAAAALFTSLWLAVSTVRGTPWHGIEPVYPGLAAALLVTASGPLARRLTRDRTAAVPPARGT